MKREWNNPEVKSLGVENTNEGDCNVVETYGVEPVWHCLTHGKYFSTYEDLQVHIKDIENNGKNHTIRAS